MVFSNNFSNKSSQTSNSLLPTVAATTTTEEENATATPKEATATAATTPTTSIKSTATTYSQKSTATAQSSNSSPKTNAHTPRMAMEQVQQLTREQMKQTNTSGEFGTPATTLVGIVQVAGSDNEVGNGSPVKTPQTTSTKWQNNEDVLKIEEIIEAVAEAAITEHVQQNADAAKALDRQGSVASLQSNLESIQTQLDETPPVLSRSQSTKSLIIEEAIDAPDNARTVNSGSSSKLCTPAQTPTNAAIDDDLIDDTKATSPLSPSRSHSPTIAELKSISRRNSMVKSMESLYERPATKPDSLDNTTETSSQSSQSLLVEPKPQHTPLKEKSKTTHSLSKSKTRRVSPVKQSIKMSQAEVYPTNLERFEKPREALQHAFDQLDEPSWEVIIVGLKSLVRMMRYHPEYLENQMHMVCIQLTRSARNLRSQVARAACQAATEIFTLRSKLLEQECDDLVCALLHRTADTNRFLRADAMRALESMCDNLTPPKVLNILTTKGAQHQNALVRTTAAKLLNRLVERLGCERVFSMPRDSRDKFFVTGANLLLEGSLETRSYAKSLFRHLSEHNSYNRLLLEVIPQRTYRNVEKTLKSIR